jgi:hypothetical protein
MVRDENPATESVAPDHLSVSVVSFSEESADGAASYIGIYGAGGL